MSTFLPVPFQAGSLGIFSTVRNIVSTVGASAVAYGLPQGPWKPQQWSTPNYASPALTMLVTGADQQQKLYVFDAIIRAEHEQRTVVTSNPVQTGAALNDHAYVIPPKLSIEIRMSDAMQSYVAGQWADSPSRSISAYQTLVGFTQPPTVIDAIHTRLHDYSNMIITEIRAIEERNTRYGLRALVTFVQVLTASIEVIAGSSQAAAKSAIPQATNATVVGNSQTNPIPANVQSQNNVTSLSPSVTQNWPRITGAGDWSSNNVNVLSTVMP